MAIRARLVAPQPVPEEWPWHEAKVTSLPISLMVQGDRRMEAENYLAGGYGIRITMEAKKKGWTNLATVCDIWQPGRLKGIHVGKRYGSPYLGATQVFDLRPTARRWLSLGHIEKSAELKVKSGTILVTRSGSVGRAIAAPNQLEEFIISDDLLRVEPKSQDWHGWIYAYLHAPQTRAMMTATKYGHMIKHLESSHLDALPVVQVDEATRYHFQKSVDQIVEERSRSHRLTTEAENLFAEALPTAAKQSWKERGFSVSAATMFDSRRRLDASRFTPRVGNLIEAFKKDAQSIEPLSTMVEEVFVPGRFKHIYGDGGTPYLDSADILEVNPDIKKFILSMEAEKQAEYHVEPGWLLIPCSGQVYGNIGHVVMATEWHIGKVLSNHIMRINPGKKVRSGYLQCALGHPQLGRPQLIRFAFGSSVPEIAPEDVKTALIPRLGSKTEDRIADLMEEAASARDKADRLEVAVSKEAEIIIGHFLAGH